MSTITVETLISGRRVPLCIARTGGSDHLHDFVEGRRALLTAKLLEHGAILFRDFNVTTAEAFSEFVAATGGLSIDYRFCSTPRRQVNGQIYTSTEYPANREILLHNENAFHSAWPLHLAFCCVLPAAQGGETPIADMHDVTRSIGAGLMDEFEARNVQYIRHFHKGIDLSWSEVFQTDDPVAVEKLCREHGIRCDWLEGKLPVLRTIQTCQGVASHPLTGQRVFFNQAHLFHGTSMGKEAVEAMQEAFGPDRLPRHSRYGDGSEIPESTISKVHAAFRDNAISFPWQRGDVLWVDNMQVAHGRRPYKGDRKVLAALMNSTSTAARPMTESRP